MRKVLFYLLLAGLAGCTMKEPDSYVAKPGVKPTVAFEIREVETEPTAGYTQVKDPHTSGAVLYLHGVARFTNDDIEKTGVTGHVIETDAYQVFVRLDQKATKRFADLTAMKIDERLAILLDGKVVMAPLIRSKIPTGSVYIEGPFTQAEAERTAKGLVGHE